jgi:hypothetical protein
MRIWSLHPAYLDSKGLLALWRETLLAKHVLLGKTEGYTRHPQLIRFKNTNYAIEYVNQYLEEVYIESQSRGYHFDKTKIGNYKEREKIPVTSGQVYFERKHLENKLSVRNKEAYNCLILSKKIMSHPLFKIVDGDIENWEVL